VLLCGRKRIRSVHVAITKGKEAYYELTFVQFALKASPILKTGWQLGSIPPLAHGRYSKSLGTVEKFGHDHHPDIQPARPRVLLLPAHRAPRNDHSRGYLTVTHHVPESSPLVPREWRSPPIPPRKP